MSISKDLLLEEARQNYLRRSEEYFDTFARYMVRYNGDEEVVRPMLFSLELSMIDAEIDFYSLYFSVRENKLALMRFLYDHVSEEYVVPSDNEPDTDKLLPAAFADKPMPLYGDLFDSRKESDNN